jgi:dihydrofolate reductase
MPKVKVGPFSVSLDGFGAGPHQDLQNPLGVRGLELHAWVFETETFQKMIGQSDDVREMERFKQMTGERRAGRGIDDDFIATSFEGVGAYIIGRNMFGPVRGPWQGAGSGAGKDEASGESWKGWWGANPPFHAPVFVLTHYARQFITDGPGSALTKAKVAAGEKDIRIGGVSVIRQYLLAGQIDEMHLAMPPVLLGEGESMFQGINLHQLGYKPLQVVARREYNAHHYQEGVTIRPAFARVERTLPSASSGQALSAAFFPTRPAKLVTWD